MDEVSALTEFDHVPLDRDVVIGSSPVPSRRLRAAVAALKPDGDPAALIQLSALSTSMIDVACKSHGESLVAWVVEENGRTLQLVEGHYVGVPDIPRKDIARANEATLLQICLSLVGGLPTMDLADMYRGISREAARRGTHIRLIVDVVRVVQQRWGGLFLAALGPQPSESDMTVVLAMIAGICDGAVDTILGEYASTRAQLLQGQLARRRGLVQAVIDDEPVEAELIKRELGVDITHHHLGIVLWFPGMAYGHELERVAKQAAADFGDTTLLTVPADGDRMWAWISSTKPHPPAHVARLADLRPSVSGVRMAVGTVAAGRAGFRCTHVQAVDAAETVRASPLSTAVTSWRDVGLLSLLGSDLERARWFVAAYLGPLGHDDALSAEHRFTLRHYFDNNQSLVHTANALHVHRNTVVYRIRKIEEILGHPLTERRGELYCAILLTDYFGARVLHS